LVKDGDLRVPDLREVVPLVVVVVGCLPPPRLATGAASLIKVLPFPEGAYLVVVVVEEVVVEVEEVIEVDCSGLPFLLGNIEVVTKLLGTPLLGKY